MRAIVLTSNRVYAAGVPTSQDSGDAPELWVLSKTDGSRQQTITLPGRPVYDGLSASGGRLYLSMGDGKLICYGGRD